MTSSYRKTLAKTTKIMLFPPQASPSGHYFVFTIGFYSGDLLDHHTENVAFPVEDFEDDPRESEGIIRAAVEALHRARNGENDDLVTVNYFGLGAETDRER